MSFMTFTMTTLSNDRQDQPKPSGLRADLEGTEKICPWSADYDRAEGVTHARAEGVVSRPRREKRE